MPNPKKQTRPSKTGSKRSPRKNQPPGRAAARLRQAVENLVTEQSEKIARALVNQTIAGNMTGARILTGLTNAEGPIEKKKKRRGPSLAERLAAEPSWDSISAEEQKRILIAQGKWDLKHDCHVDESWRHEDDPFSDDPETQN